MLKMQPILEVPIKYDYCTQNKSTTLVREKEMTKTYTKHDQLFKEVIHTFFSRVFRCVFFLKCMK